MTDQQEQRLAALVAARRRLFEARSRWLNCAEVAAVPGCSAATLALEAMTRAELDAALLALRTIEQERP